MSICQLSDSVFEALLRQAVIDSVYDEVDSLPPDDELAEMYTFSDAHERRMKRLFAREARKENLRNFAKWGRKVAAVIIIIITLLFSSLIFVPQIRATVVETLIEWYERFVRFTSNAQETENANLDLGYIPEGFIEVAREELETMTTVIYMSESEESIITIHLSQAVGSTSVDSEDMNYSVLEIDGIQYHLFEAENMGGENSILWYTNEHCCTIMSTIPTDELLKIAISIIIKYFPKNL